MPLVTTTIGAWPKPEFVRLPDWFTHPEGPDAVDPTSGWARAMAALGDDAEAIIARGVAEAIDDQVGAGIDIPTDGEIARENYIHYHCRHLEGVSFERLEEKSLRSGAYRAWLPAIVGPVRAGAPFLPADYRRAQSCTDRAIKITMPGPMTIGGHDGGPALRRPAGARARSGRRPQPRGARPRRRGLPAHPDRTSRCSRASPTRRSTTGSSTSNARSTAAPGTSPAPSTCAAAIPTGWIAPTIPRPIPAATSAWPTRSKTPPSTRSASRTPIGPTTCRCWSGSGAPPSSSGWSPLRRAGSRTRKRSPSVSARPWGTSTRTG